jgi:hypothetical protein
MSNLKVNSIEPANAGSEDYFLARAWVNFNGTGTVAIRADGNVSSITDLGTGNYRVNQSSGQVDANYAASVLFGNSSGYTANTLRANATHTSSSTDIASIGFGNGIGYDRDICEFTLVR